MAGKRRKVVANNYDELIEKAQKALTKLESDATDIRTKIRQQRAKIKQLEKDKAAYNEQKKCEEKDRQMKEVAEMIVGSGKSIEEIKKFLNAK